MNRDHKGLDAKTYDLIRNVWERNWAHEDYAPTWVTSKIPRELRDAVDHEWYPLGENLLDIGCGSGELAAWLAEQHFNVLGVDFSVAAIERAKTTYREHRGRLAFQVADMCRDTAPFPRFNALFDRGCLQGLPQSAYPDYAKTVASWALSGARFLLLCGIHRGVRIEESVKEELYTEMMARLQRVFSPQFDIIDWKPTALERRPSSDSIPGIAVRMNRK